MRRTFIALALLAAASACTKSTSTNVSSTPSPVGSAIPHATAAPAMHEQMSPQPSAMHDKMKP